MESDTQCLLNIMRVINERLTISKQYFCCIYKSGFLRKGTTFVFCAICFNSSGEFLCLQGSQPDFGISVWKWREG